MSERLTYDDWYKLLTLVERDNAAQGADDEPQDTDLEQKLSDQVALASHDAQAQAQGASALNVIATPDGLIEIFGDDPVTDYLVTWTIDIQARSTREAAELALETQRDSGSTAVVFQVAAGGVSELVDLAEPTYRYDPASGKWVPDEAQA